MKGRLTYIIIYIYIFIYLYTYILIYIYIADDLLYHRHHPLLGGLKPLLLVWLHVRNVIPDHQKKWRRGYVKWVLGE